MFCYFCYVSPSFKINCKRKLIIIYNMKIIAIFMTRDNCNPMKS